MVTLDEIIGHKKKELLVKKKTSLPPPPKREKDQSYRFQKTIAHPKNGSIAIIGEVKLASPSAGILGEEASIPTRVRAYERAGVDALSVVVDKKYFHGDIRFITEIKEHSSLPILAKDFVIDEYQIHELVDAGADAVLLIAKILDDPQLFSFSEELLSLGVDPVVEVQNEDELEKALRVQAKIIAVNARNLSDFHVDIETACTLMRKIPNDRIALGFSGIQDKEDILSYREAGAKGVLIGTSLMKTDNIDLFMKGLV